MSDLISRQWLMECVNEGWIKFDTEKDENTYIHLVRDIAPFAQPERKKGRWIIVKRHEHYPSGKPYEQAQCPFCKRFDNNGDGSFCGYCGAKMDGGKKNEHTD